MIQYLDIEHNREISSALWRLCKMFADVYNDAMVELQDNPDMLSETTEDCIGLFDHLDGIYRSDPTHPTAQLPAGAYYEAAGQAYKNWRAWRDLETKDLQAADERGLELWPAFKNQKDLDCNAENYCAINLGVYCSDIHTVILPGELKLRTAQGIFDRKNVYACRFVERTSKEFAENFQCSPEDRLFSIILQRHE